MLEDLGILHLETRSTLKIIFRLSIWNLKFIRGLWRPQRGFLHPPQRKAKYYIYLISSTMSRLTCYNNLYADIRKRSGVHGLLITYLCLYSYFTQSRQLLACFSIEPWGELEAGIISPNVFWLLGDLLRYYIKFAHISELILSFLRLLRNLQSLKIPHFPSCASST